MTEQERINFALQRQMEKLDARMQLQMEKLDARIKKQMDEQAARMNVMDARIDSTLAELKEQREDIRRLNEKIDSKFDKLSAQIQTMSLTTILGVGAIVWAVVSALK